MGDKRLRAVVSEEAYGVLASIVPEPESFRSDRLATAFQIAERARQLGRSAELVEEADFLGVKLFLGDAPEDEFEDAAEDLLQAACW